MSARTPRVGGGRTNRTPRSGRTQTTKDSGTKASLRTCDLTGNAWLERQTAKIEAKAKEVQDLYVGNQLIKPRWMKVSKTPWTSLKAASGGYGRRVYNSAISDEMPPFMHIDVVDAHDAHAHRARLHALGDAARPRARRAVMQHRRAVAAEHDRHVGVRAQRRRQPRTQVGARKRRCRAGGLSERSLAEHRDGLAEEARRVRAVVVARVPHRRWWPRAQRPR